MLFRSDKKFETWFTIPLLVLGMAAGARNAFVLARDVIRQDERRRKRQQEKEIQEKVKRANQKKIDEELRR